MSGKSQVASRMRTSKSSVELNRKSARGLGTGGLGGLSISAVSKDGMLPTYSGLPPIRSFDQSSKRRAPLSHWQKEKMLLKIHYKMLLLCCVWQYVHSVATNVAYYLHVQRPPLTDLGYELLPALSKRAQIVSEIMFFTCFVLTIAFILHPLFIRRKKKQLYVVTMLSRLCSTLVLAQTLRIVCFLVTTLPGPNYHCRPNSPDYSPPKSLFDILARQDAFFGCGDLVFSSHTIFVVLFALVWHKYWPNFVVRSVVWTLVFIFGLLVVAARKHYSLDIMVAWYTVPLIWYAYDYYFPDKFPIDFQGTLPNLSTKYSGGALAAV